ncbi:Putative ammonia monooxygenase [Neisseria zoodegmatis]|uniref:Ammonia monooxygenase n=1 Tax=Neisseria zoodegmatis TaxID=326523 RepID=A0A378WEE0_9NEIS|nr:AbrB family transcriptional regulator [Neisseria zoodegmatis]SUA35689.1 Putative ammonia monooxygenase [Neisseria zoodegmatis]
MNTFTKYSIGFAAALAGALAANAVGLPIPWLLGSLLATAVLSLNGLPVKAPGLCRKAGLTIIGVSLGLYFTPDMVGLLLEYWPWLLFGMVFSVSLGVLGSLLLYRFAGVDFVTAWFASAMGGASEMANMADQKGAQVDKVVSAHSLRVLMIVTIVPFFYQYMGYQNIDNSVLQQNTHIHWGGLILLFGLAYMFAKLFEWRKWSNPWTFGPLLAAILLTVSDIHLSAMPPMISKIGQLFIGWALGNKFSPGFFKSAPRLLSVVAVSVSISLALTASATYVLAKVSGIPLPTLGLGLSPGGVAEMTITAKVLQLGVPVVTAFHVSRMVAVVGTAGVLCRFMEGWVKGRIESR